MRLFLGCDEVTKFGHGGRPEDDGKPVSGHAHHSTSSEYGDRTDRCGPVRSATLEDVLEWARERGLRIEPIMGSHEIRDSASWDLERYGEMLRDQQNENISRMGGGG